MSEDQGDVELELRANGLEFRAINLKLAENAAHLGVLATVDEGCSTELLANLVELVGADVVDGDQETFVVLGKMSLELLSQCVFAVF